MKAIIEKVLSSNDVGATGAHQGGILIPKKVEILDFFPQLDRQAENPRVIIRFTDDLDQIWKFNYIYYNNRLRGGTRNEFRLTGMTAFLKSSNAREGDILIFEKNNEAYSIRLKKQSEIYVEDNGVIMLVLDNSWRVIKY